MMRKLFKLSLLILLSIKGIHVYSQDSLSKKGAIDISTSLWGLAFITPKNPSIIIPNSLLIRRTLYNNSTTKPDKKITDNPLEHAPMYFALHSKTTISEGIYLNADLYAEHRGISYGVYNTKNMVVYPVLNFNINDTLALLKQKIYVKFSALHLLNERLDNGLYIYNVDVQGAKLNLSHGNLLLEASMYGDLSNGIGLKIDDLYNLKIQKAISKTQSFGISLSVDYGFFKKLFQDNYLNVLYNYSKNNHSVYAQVGFRLLNANNKFSEKLAYVTGYQLEKSFLKHSHKLGVEVRYYGRTFNSNRFDDSLRFRDANKPIYANTTGSFLYPLRKYNTRFSQWAVYTEHAGSNIYSINVFGYSRFNITNKTEASMEHDLNFIRAQVSSGNLKRKTDIFYPFITLGYFYKPVKDFKMGVILTNKGMNLDLSYPTQYLYKYPHIGVAISKGI